MQVAVKQKMKKMMQSPSKKVVSKLRPPRERLRS